jgi:hypothetical protein
MSFLQDVARKKTKYFRGIAWVSPGHNDIRTKRFIKAVNVIRLMEERGDTGEIINIPSPG